jgi:hypothetical protein
MTTDPKDALIDELVEMYKGAYLAYLVWQQVASEGWQGHIPQPVLETARQRHLPYAEALFAEFDQARKRGLPAQDTLRLLLAKLRQSVR